MNKRELAKAAKANNALYSFAKWAKENGINLKHREDWGPWWKCYAAGYGEGRKSVQEELG